MKGYSHEYAKHKPSRTLKWLPTYGTVTLELEMEEGVTREMVVTPPQVYSLFLPPS